MTLSPAMQAALKKRLSVATEQVSAVRINNTTISDEILLVLVNRIWGAVPEPSEDFQLPTVKALKEGYETLVRSRGNVEDSAVLVSDLISVVELLIPYILNEVEQRFHP
tara:strand:- start:1308 stop:1634 length:327 start_codon:yes stop_codon:yes gene_type:complete